MTTSTPNFTTLKLCQEKLALAPNEIHLWLTDPNDITANDESLLSQYRTLLSEQETIKQQRYKFAKDRHDALITRAFVRDLLSYYADIAPQAWRFEKGEKDKPELVNPPLALRFNISHTKGLIACAVTLHDDIGCDVEDTSRSNDVLAIAERYFSSQETTELFALPSEQQRSRFFDYWTLKESYIKAWGLGLAIPLADFSFLITDQEKSTVSNNHFQIKDNIRLSFAPHRVDEPSIWRSWIIYPQVNEQHRIALSLRSASNKNNQDSQINLRFFKTQPLQGYQELS
ncbi:4'-phosphopantetheinyl transferase superfamily protein [Colwellia asteriadis]|uniref:4'-phosphopantetheinyl transferase superfamily protein n=1 Tax=Colwellia asteriadis TaxID=517723 RepID=A0ABN1L957_9GAMM